MLAFFSMYYPVYYPVSLSGNLVMPITVTAFSWLVIGRIADRSRDGTGWTHRLVHRWDSLPSEQRSSLNVGSVLLLFGALLLGSVILQPSYRSFEPLLAFLCLILGGWLFGRGVVRIKHER